MWNHDQWETGKEAKGKAQNQPSPANCLWQIANGFALNSASLQQLKTIH
jgi:hypothetical protein